MFIDMHIYMCVCIIYYINYILCVFRYIYVYMCACLFITSSHYVSLGFFETYYENKDSLYEFIEFLYFCYQSARTNSDVCMPHFHT